MSSNPRDAATTLQSDTTTPGIALPQYTPPRRL
jgi:hypothetical protein